MTDTPHQSTIDRKAEILRLGQQAVARRGERRRARRHAVAMVLLTASATVVAFALAPTRIGNGPAPIADATTELPMARIVRVGTTPGLATALAAPGSPAVRRAALDPAAIARVETTPIDMAQRLTDREALALLEEAGRPAGILRVGGRVTLVYHERPEADPGPSGLLPEPAGATLAAARPYRPL